MKNITIKIIAALVCLLSVTACHDVTEYANNPQANFEDLCKNLYDN